MFQSKFSKNMMNHCIAGKCRKSSVTERQGEQRPIGGSHYFLLPGEPAYTTHLREGRSGMELRPNLCGNANAFQFAEESLQDNGCVPIFHSYSLQSRRSLSDCRMSSRSW